MSRYYWLMFVILAGLSWGVYVPAIAFGGKTLRNPYASFLCVGVAYFIIAVIVPVYILWRRGQMVNWSGAGVTFATGRCGRGHRGPMRDLRLGVPRWRSAFHRTAYLRAAPISTPW